MKINRTYQRIIALTLAFLMLITSTTFAVDMHYCKGKLKSVSLLGKAKTCHEKAGKEGKSICPYHQKIAQDTDSNKITKKDCCENKTTVVKSDHDRTKVDLPVPTIQQLQQFVIAYTLVFYTEITTDKQSIQEFSYQSPIISRDIYALSEAFLL